MPLDQLIPGMVGVALTTAATVYFGRLWWFSRAAKRWPSVPGRVVTSRVEKRAVHTQQRQAPSFRHVFRYEYEVGGRTFHGERRYFGDLFEWGREDAQRHVDRFPVGAAVTVLHDPGEPSRSTLEARRSAWVVAYTLLAGTILLLILQAFVAGE